MSERTIQRARSSRLGVVAGTTCSGCKTDGVPTAIAIEYMAQAVAAHQGLLDRRAGRPVCEGFLLGARRMDIHLDVLPIGLQLHAIVRRDFDLGGEFGRYACRLVVADDGSCVAEGDLKVFQSPQWVAELKGAGK